MTIGYNLEEFNGKPVQDYSTDDGITHPETVCYRIRLDYDQWDEGISLEDVVRTFAADPHASSIKELVIGIWGFEGGGNEGVRDALIECAPSLSNLEALMIGDITYEENEISWIESSDLAPLVMAFPKLREFRARGGNGLELDGLKHPTLEKLVLEAGGLSTKTIQDAITADCPNLLHLELWLGVDDYGFDGSVDTLGPLLTGSVHPRLEVLALRDSEIADDIAAALGGMTTSILDRIEILDLSMGTLSDEGARALAENPAVKNLEKLDVHYHYISDEWIDRLRALGIEVDASDQQDLDDDWRYPAVTE